MDYVRICPIEYRSIPCELASCVAIEMRIKILTSQLEDSLFKIIFHGVNSQTMELIPGMTCESELIRVISKPEQIRKGKKEDSGKINITPVRMASFNPQLDSRPQNFNSQAVSTSFPMQAQKGEIASNLQKINDC